MSYGNSNTPKYLDADCIDKKYCAFGYQRSSSEQAKIFERLKISRIDRSEVASLNHCAKDL